MAISGLAAEIGRRIMLLRNARGWSQQDLARRAGLASKSVISYYELGDRFPSCESLIRLADVLGVTVDYLIRGDDNPHNNIQVNANADGDTYIRVRAGTLSNKQIDAIIHLIRSLSETDE